MKATILILLFVTALFIFLEIPLKENPRLGKCKYVCYSINKTKNTAAEKGCKWECE